MTLCCVEILLLQQENQESALDEERNYHLSSPSTPSIKSYYPFFIAFPRRPAGIIDGTTLPGPAGLEVSFLPSTAFDLGAAARDPLFIFTPPLIMLRR
jgi:hypothetical protein